MSAGTEVECSVLGSTRSAQASEPGEIVIEADWYDFAAKYEPGGMQLRVPARISATARDELRATAVAAFAHFGCSGLARADFFVEGERVLLNELNTMPGLHADERLREALGGQRPGLRRARRAPRARWRSSATPTSGPTASRTPSAVQEDLGDLDGSFSGGSFVIQTR